MHSFVTVDKQFYAGTPDDRSECLSPHTHSCGDADLCPASDADGVVLSCSKYLSVRALPD